MTDPFRGNETNNALIVLATSNPTLGAEEGDTITTGFVWQPSFADWVDGLQLSLDWYEIDLSGAVAPWGAQRIVDDCFATGAASACDLILGLRSRGVEPEAMEAALASADTGNPYTGEPFDWDTASGEIVFDGIAPQRGGRYAFPY